MYCNPYGGHSLQNVHNRTDKKPSSSISISTMPFASPEGGGSIRLDVFQIGKMGLWVVKKTKNASVRHAKDSLGQDENLETER